MFYPFFSLYLQSVGISDGNLGLILAISPLTALIVNPFWSWYSKDANMNRKIIRGLTIIEAIAILLFTTLSGVEVFVILTILLAFAATPYYSLQDGFTANYAASHNVEYSSIRFFGSIAYVIAPVSAGLLIAKFGYMFVFYIAAFAFLTTAILLTWIHPLVIEETSVDRPKSSIKLLINNFQFFKYIIFYMLCIGTMVVGDAFFAVYLKSRGIAPSQYGLIMTMFISFEAAVLFYLSRYGHKYTPQKLFLIASAFVILRFSVNGFQSPIWMVILFATLRGAGWGIILYANIRYITRLVRVQNVTLAMLIMSVLNAIYVGVGNMLAGQINAKYGYDTLYLILASIALFALLFFLFFRPRRTIPKRLSDESVAL